MTFRGISRVALRENEILARKIHRLRTKTPNHPVAYFHGGGFVAANACVLTQSVVPIARGGRRGGFEVYAADYPMGQVCTLLRALQLMWSAHALRWIS